MDTNFDYIGDLAPVRVDLLFEDLTEEEKVDLMMYLLKNTYTEEDNYDGDRQSFLWIVYDRIEEYTENDILTSLFDAWNQILDIVPEDKKNNISISIDYNESVDIYLIMIMDWNGLVGHEGPAYAEEITDENVMRELMSIIMYKAYSVDNYGPGGHKEL